MSYDTFSLGVKPPKAAVASAGVIKKGPPRSTATVPSQTPAMNFHMGTSYVYESRADPEGNVVNSAGGYDRMQRIWILGGPDFVMVPLAWNVGPCRCHSLGICARCLRLGNHDIRAPHRLTAAEIDEQKQWIARAIRLKVYQWEQKEEQKRDEATAQKLAQAQLKVAGETALPARVTSTARHAEAARRREAAINRQRPSNRKLAPVEAASFSPTAAAAAALAAAASPFASFDPGPYLSPIPARDRKPLASLSESYPGASQVHRARDLDGRVRPKTYYKLAGSKPLSARGMLQPAGKIRSPTAGAFLPSPEGLNLSPVKASQLLAVHDPLSASSPLSSPLIRPSPLLSGGGMVTPIARRLMYTERGPPAQIVVENRGQVMLYDEQTAEERRNAVR